MYRRVDWRWAQNGTPAVSQGWKPECGFLHYGWEGYNEATILYVLGLGSPTFPLTPAGYVTWSLTYQWENLLDRDVLYSGPLFTHLFSHAWIDFRGIRDAFMREKAQRLFREHEKRHRHPSRIWRTQSARVQGLRPRFLGHDSGRRPGDQEMRENGRDRRFFGYMSRGVPYGPDDGTIAPWAMLATLPFAPEAALAGTRHLLEAVSASLPPGQIFKRLQSDAVERDGGWLSEGWYGLDQGLLVMMIENHRTGMIWEIMRHCGYVRDGLKRAGFRRRVALAMQSGTPRAKTRRRGNLPSACASGGLEETRCREAPTISRLWERGRPDWRRRNPPPGSGSPLHLSSAIAWAEIR